MTDRERGPAVVRAFRPRPHFPTARKANPLVHDRMRRPTRVAQKAIAVHGEKNVVAIAIEMEVEMEMEIGPKTSAAWKARPRSSSATEREGDQKIIMMTKTNKQEEERKRVEEHKTQHSSHENRPKKAKFLSDGSRTCFVGIRRSAVSRAL